MTLAPKMGTCDFYYRNFGLYSQGVEEWKRIVEANLAIPGTFVDQDRRFGHGPIKVAARDLLGGTIMAHELKPRANEYTCASNILDISKHELVYYAPVDPSMTEVDVHRAVEAYPNEAGTAWLFRHTNQGTHDDHELLLAAVIEAPFQQMFRQYQYDALNTDSAQAITRANDSFKSLAIFHGRVFREAKKIARAKHLGERHQDPHPSEGHLKTEALEAIAVVKADWIEKGKTDRDTFAQYELIKSGIEFIEGAFSITAAETRQAKAARLAAESEASS